MLCEDHAMGGGAPGPALREREAELAALSRALDGASAAGGGSLVLVEGPAGIGKTRLLDETVARAAARGWLVLCGRGGELERSDPYGVVRQLLERELAAAPPARRRQLLDGAAARAGRALGLAGAPAADEFAILHGLYWLVAGLTAQRALLLAVDDLHWADAASVRFVAYLARRLADLPVVLVVAVRPRELEDHIAVRTLLAAPATPDAIVLRPAPLSSQATSALLGELLATAPDAKLCATCLEVTGGIPFFVRELAAALACDAASLRPGGARRVAGLTTEAVARSIMLRLAGERLPVVELAASVAVLGDGATVRDAAELAEIELATAQRAVTALVRREVLAARLPLSFAHPIVRNAVLEDLPAVRHATLHARAAELCARRAAPPERTAGHLLHVEPAGDAARAATLLAAGETALDRGAPGEAVRFLRRALDEPPGDELRGAVLARLGAAEFLVDPGARAALVHLRAAIGATSDATARATLWLVLARAAQMSSVQACVDVLQEALAALPDLRGEPLERLRGELVWHAATHPRTAAVCDRLAAAIDEPAGSGPADRLQLISLALREVRSVGSAERTIALCRRALDGGALLAHEGADSTALYQMAYHLTFADAYDEASATMTAALAAAQARGSTWGMAAACGTRAWIAYRAGDLPGAEADARRPFAAASLPALAQAFVRSCLALVLVEREELEEAEAVLAGVPGGVDATVVIHASHAFVARGMLRRAQLRHEEALADFLTYGARAAAVGWDGPAIAWRAEAAELLAPLGRGEEARRLVAEQLTLARRWGAPTGLGIGLRAAGVVQGGAGGVRLLREAVDVLARSPSRLEHVRALLALGAALRRAGSRRESCDVLRRAIELARACGALRLARLGREELLSSGARPRRAHFSGVESLTAAERRVCELAAEGLSNREIAQALYVSAKTVENQLGHAYAKLAIRSRSALACALSGARGSSAEPPRRGTSGQSSALT